MASTPNIDGKAVRRSYYGWLLAAKLAEWLGMEVGVTKHEESDTYAVVIELPSGQIHNVIPGYMMEGKWKSFDESKYEERRIDEELKSIEDCLFGTLVSKHVLLIPEQKEETE